MEIPTANRLCFCTAAPAAAAIRSFPAFLIPTVIASFFSISAAAAIAVPLSQQTAPKSRLTNNTTDHLTEDIIKLRKALNIDSKMHVIRRQLGQHFIFGLCHQAPGNRGDAHSARHLYRPHRRPALYVSGQCRHLRAEPLRLTAPGAYITYPEAWKPFVEMIPPEKRGDMMKAYKEIFDMVPANQAEKDLQMKAAISWSVWEGVISHLVPDMTDVGKFGEDDFAVCFAQIEAHYFANNLFLKPGYLIDNVPALANVPVHIVHGRYNQVCPLTQADILVSALRQAGIGTRELCQNNGRSQRAGTRDLSGLNQNYGQSSPHARFRHARPHPAKRSNASF